MLLFMWIILMVLVALLAYVILKSRPVAAVPVTSSRLCANCHQPVQNDWAACPHCGHIL
jgi:transposase